MSIKASNQYFLSASMMELMAQDACFQTLTSLKTWILHCDVKVLVEIFKVYWMSARQLNNVNIGIHSMTIEVVGTSEKEISEFLWDIAVIQKELGPSDTKITL